MIGRDDKSSLSVSPTMGVIRELRSNFLTRRGGRPAVGNNARLAVRRERRSLQVATAAKKRQSLRFRFIVHVHGIAIRLCDPGFELDRVNSTPV